ncbi:HEPN domain-containing protein [Imperialibacter roseus]|uniref:HEPN domain-containing protein n=1 Tax=Imperialibacter roseus TaxID=1324217 RepID=A0ABZ0IW99_9BACT|nr:HEPN domain-containing protein [Imperialibacter roseus]WOK08787.1 HEPN domain-containing protein [Imperialibacter roseus]
MGTIVDSLFAEHRNLVAYLNDKKEVSMKIFVEENFKKNILLSIASLFEHQITSILREFINKAGGENSKLNSFVYNGAISRKYHTLFEWDSNSGANKFFSLFGEECKKDYKEKIKADEELERSVIAFLQLGQQRNRLVHLNFGEYFIEKTADEIYLEYLLAKRFLTFVEAELKD